MILPDSSLKTTGLEEPMIFQKKGMETWLEAQLGRSWDSVGKIRIMPGGDAKCADPDTLICGWTQGYISLAIVLNSKVPQIGK